MPWNSIFPDGNVSVKANETIGQQNTTYTEVTLGKSVVGSNTSATRDHFWKVGSNEDGRHRFIQSLGFTSTAEEPNNVYPAMGAGMQTVLFPLTTNNEVQWFHKNELLNAKIYQVTPNFLKGTIAIPSSSYVTITPVPSNCYGEITMWTDTLGRYSSVVAHFRSNGTIVEAWGFVQSDDSDVTNAPLKFAAAGQAVDLNLKARRSDAGSATWNYRLTYRAI